MQPNGKWVKLSSDAKSEEKPQIPKEPPKALEGKRSFTTRSFGRAIGGKKRRGKSRGFPSEGRPVSSTRMVRYLPNGAVQVDTTPVIAAAHLFRASSALALAPISAVKIACALGGVCTVVNSTVTSFVSSFRIKKIVICAAQASNAEGTEVQWFQNPAGQAKDASQGTAQPGGTTMSAVAEFVPPPYALAYSWVNATQASGVMFNISAPDESVIVVEAEYTLSNNYTGIGAVSVSTATLGVTYYLSLDGSVGLIRQLERPTTL
jgi:hypothetical protein